MSEGVLDKIKQQCVDMGMIVAYACECKRIKWGGIKVNRYIVIGTNQLCIFSNKAELKWQFSWFHLIEFTVEDKNICYKFTDETLKLIIENPVQIVKCTYDVISHINTQSELLAISKNEDINLITVPSTVGAYSRLIELSKLTEFNVNHEDVRKMRDILLFKQPSVILSEFKDPDNFIILLLRLITLCPSIESLYITKFSSGNPYYLFQLCDLDGMKIKFISIQGEAGIHFTSFINSLRISQRVQISGLGFKESKFNRNHVESLQDIVTSKHITHLEFDNAFDGTGQQYFCNDFLQSNISQTLQSLSIINCPKIAIDIVLQRIPYIQIISLKNCNFDVTQLLPMFNKNSDLAIRILDLSGNRASKAPIRQFDFLPSLRMLILDNIKYEDVQTFLSICTLAFTRINPTSHISMSNAEIPKDDWKIVYPELEKITPVSLRTLRWDNNPVVSTFSAFLLKLTELKNLSLIGCYSNEDTVLINDLAYYLKENKSLEGIILKGSKTRYFGGSTKIVIKGLCENKSIRNIILSNTRGGDSAAVSMQDLFKRELSPQILDFDGLLCKNKEFLLVLMKLGKKIGCKVSFPLEDFKYLKISEKEIQEYQKEFLVSRFDDFVAPFYVYKYHGQYESVPVINTELGQLILQELHFDVSKKVKKITSETKKSRNSMRHVTTPPISAKRLGSNKSVSKDAIHASNEEFEIRKGDFISEHSEDSDDSDRPQLRRLRSETAQAQRAPYIKPDIPERKESNNNIEAKANFGPTLTELLAHGIKNTGIQLLARSRHNTALQIPTLLNRESHYFGDSGEGIDDENEEDNKLSLLRKNTIFESEEFSNVQVKQRKVKKIVKSKGVPKDQLPKECFEGGFDVDNDESFSYSETIMSDDDDTQIGHIAKLIQLTNPVTKFLSNFRSFVSAVAPNDPSQVHSMPSGSVKHKKRPSIFLFETPDELANLKDDDKPKEENPTDTQEQPNAPPDNNNPEPTVRKKRLVKRKSKSSMSVIPKDGAELPPVEENNNVINQPEKAEPVEYKTPEQPPVQLKKRKSVRRVPHKNISPQQDEQVQKPKEIEPVTHEEELKPAITTSATRQNRRSSKVIKATPAPSENTPEHLSPIKQPQNMQKPQAEEHPTDISSKTVIRKRPVRKASKRPSVAASNTNAPQTKPVAITFDTSSSSSEEVKTSKSISNRRIINSSPDKSPQKKYEVKIELNSSSSEEVKPKQRQPMRQQKRTASAPKSRAPAPDLKLDIIESPPPKAPAQRKPPPLEVTIEEEETKPKPARKRTKRIPSVK